MGPATGRRRRLPRRTSSDGARRAVESGVWRAPRATRGTWGAGVEHSRRRDRGYSKAQRRGAQHRHHLLHHAPGAGAGARPPQRPPCPRRARPASRVRGACAARTPARSWTPSSLVFESRPTHKKSYVDMTHCCPNASSVAATTAAHRFLFVLRWVGDEESGTWLTWQQRPRLTLCATAKLVSAACRSAHALMASSSWGSWGRHRSALPAHAARRWRVGSALTVQRSDR